MNRIKQLRKEKGLTLQQVADDLTAALTKQGERHIAKSTVLRWENEKNSPTAEMWGLLADYFGVSVDYLQGAWSRKEVLELMSSSLLDNYERIFEMAKEYEGEGNEFDFFQSIDLNLWSNEDANVFAGDDVEEIEKKQWFYVKEMRSNYSESLSFDLLRFVYFQGYCRNLYTKEHLEDIKATSESTTLSDGEKAYRLDIKGYPETKGYEHVESFINGFLKFTDNEGRASFLDYFFSEFDSNDILENNVVIEKMMQEKVSSETMTLALVSTLEKAILNFDAIARGRQYRYISKKYRELQIACYGLLKENDRLKAELTSKR
ncbi:helix-turn-helix domain-containing protein [Lactobacillus delbrueckii]|uniref:helix-turn-helix domain-containing protein n=1 Tax=Lactobacillus delbrueckii TaxID=1584 RepID=UPI00128C9CD7|nr:helix-turn-helix transcriptional regulator [Lactobacillus delbrueckii]MPW12010.1 helix-turn-helix domain-containing protein [Lactobacillus delbrueckii]